MNPEPVSHLALSPSSGFEYQTLLGKPWTTLKATHWPNDSIRVKMLLSWVTEIGSQYYINKENHPMWIRQHSLWGTWVQTESLTLADTD